jgi:hypothetical protein
MIWLGTRVKYRVEIFCLGCFVRERELSLPRLSTVPQESIKAVAKSGSLIRANAFSAASVKPNVSFNPLLLNVRMAM